jgi:hypothetical protein
MASAGMSWGAEEGPHSTPADFDANEGQPSLASRPTWTMVGVSLNASAGAELQDPAPADPDRAGKGQDRAPSPTMRDRWGS